MTLQEKIKETIRDVKDYPQPGIVFKDITPVLSDPALLHEITSSMVSSLKTLNIDAIAAVEARGFIFGAILAHQLKCKFIPVRKEGKLPYLKRTQAYDLEYGSARVEMHVDAIQPGWRVLVHDDLLATGGTAIAAAELIKSFGGQLAGFSFLINLGFLQGEKRLIELYGVKPKYLISY